MSESVFSFYTFVNNYISNIKARQGFSMMGLIVIMIFVLIAFSATVPLLTMKQDVKTNTSKYVSDCVENSLAIDSQKCQGAIRGLQNDLEKDYETIIALAENAAYKDEVMALARQACDGGGKRACRLLMDQCVQDSALCDVNTDTDLNDIDYYLKLAGDAAGAGRAYVEFLGIGYYEKGMSNFVSHVDTVCAADVNSTACDIAQYTTATVTYEFYESEEGLFAQSDDTITNFVSSAVTMDIPDAPTGGGAGGTADCGTWAKSIIINSEPTLVNDIEFDNSGNIYIGGSYGTTGPDFVVKYNKEFTEQWRSFLKGGNNDDYLIDMVVDDTGVYYVGRRNEGCGIAKLNLADGSYAWADENVEYDSDSNYCTGIYVDDAYIYAVGDGKEDGTHLFKLNKSDGTEAQTNRRIYASDLAGTSYFTTPGNLVYKGLGELGTGEYVKYYDSTVGDWFYEVEIDTDGDVIIGAGWRSDASAVNNRHYVLEADPATGQIIKSKSITDESNYIPAMALDGSGNIITTGRGDSDWYVGSVSNDFSTLNFAQDINDTNQASDLYIYNNEYYTIGDSKITKQLAIAKHTSTGTLSWLYGITGGGTVSGDYSKLLVDGSGNMYIFADLDSSTNFELIKITSALAVDSAFTFTYSGSGGAFSDAAWAPDGNIYLIEKDNMAILKIDASNGDILIDKKYTKSGTNASFFGMTLDSSGYIYVVGEDDKAGDSGNSEAIILKLEENGTGNDFNLVWGLKYGGEYDDVAYDVAHDGNGYIYVVGSEDVTAGSDDSLIIDSFLLKISDTQTGNFTPTADGTYAVTKSVLAGIGLSLDTASYTTGDVSASNTYPVTTSDLNPYWNTGTFYLAEGVNRTSTDDYAGWIYSLTSDFAAFNWQVKYDLSNYQEFQNIGFGSNGYLYVYGNDNTGSDFATLVKVDPADGSTIWKKTLSNFHPDWNWTGHKQRYGNNLMTFDTEGNIYLAGRAIGSASPNGDNDIVVVKLTESGTEPNTTLEYVWGRVFGTATYDIPKVLKYHDTFLYMGGYYGSADEDDLDNPDAKGFLMKLSTNQTSNFTSTIADWSVTPAYPLTDTPADDTDDMLLADGTLLGTDTFTLNDYNSTHTAAFTDLTDTDLTGADTLGVCSDAQWMYGFHYSSKTKSEYFNSIYIDSDDNIHVMASGPLGGNSTAWYYYRFGADGTTVIEQSFDGFTDKSPFITIDGMGDIVVVGTCASGICYMKLNTDADSILTQKDIISNGDELLHNNILHTKNCVFFEPNGNIYTVGKDVDGGFFAKFNSDFTLLFAKFFDNLSNYTPNNIITDEDGNIYLSMNDNNDFSLARLDPTGNSVDWSFSELSSEDADDNNRSFIVNGYLYSIGYGGSGVEGAIFTKVDPIDGTIIYSKAIKHSSREITQTNLYYYDGSFYIAADIDEDPINDVDVVVFKVTENLTGDDITLDWAVLLGEPGGIEEEVRNIFVRNGMVVVVGRTESGSDGSEDGFIAKFTTEQTSNITGFTVSDLGTSWDEDTTAEHNSGSITDSGPYVSQDITDISFDSDSMDRRDLQGTGFVGPGEGEEAEPTTSSAYVTTTDYIQISNKLKQINSITITQDDTDAASEIRWMVCFDGVTYCDANDTWYYYDDATTSWVTNTKPENFATGVGSTSTEIQANVATMPFVDGDTLDFAFWLYTTSDATTAPSVNSVAVEGVFAK